MGGSPANRCGVTARLARDIAAAAARGGGLTYTTAEVQEIAAEMERNQAAGLAEAIARMERTQAAARRQV